MKNIYIYIALFLTFAVSCSSEEKDAEDIIAKTKMQKLYKSEVLASMPISLSKEDSVAFVKSYVEQWLHFALLYEKAYDNVHGADSSLEKRIERFKQELYINEYEQLFLQQKLDTLVPQQEIDAFYNAHKSEYILQNTVVKPIFIVFPLSQPEKIEKVEKLFSSKKESDYDVLKDYCFTNCQRFSFPTTWVNLDAVKSELPFEARAEHFEVGKNFKFTDTSNVYFVKITDEIKAGERMPEELAHDQIAKSILQTKKIQLIQNMRDKIYQDAAHKKQFEIYY